MLVGRLAIEGIQRNKGKVIEIAARNARADLMAKGRLRQGSARHQTTRGACFNIWANICKLNAVAWSYNLFRHEKRPTGNKALAGCKPSRETTDMCLLGTAGCSARGICYGIVSEAIKSGKAG